MRRSALMGVAAVAFVASSAFAQATSFAGTWNMVQDPAQQQAAGGGGGRGGFGGFGMTFSVEQDAKTLTIKLSEDELHMAHAIADAESIGRYVRRVIAHDYKNRYGEAPPPKAKLRPGPGTKSTGPR